MMGIFTLRCSFDHSWKRIKIFLPFIWPRTLELKIYFVLSICLLVFCSILNVYPPIFSKKIVDSLMSKDNEKPEFRWDLVCIYSLLRYLKGLDDIKEIFWTKVEQNMNKELEISVFSHIQNLSTRWHLSRKTGEVLEIINKSKNCISYLLNLSVLYLVPSIVDTIFIIVYLTFLFDIWLNLVLCACMIFYMVYIVTVREKLSKLRKDEIQANYDVKQKSLDSLLNFETVKYFGNEKYEVNAFRKAVTALQEGEFKTMKVEMISRAASNFVVDFSVMIGTLMCVYKVVETEGLTVGDYVMFSDYFVQIYSSVHFFAHVYKTFKGYLVDVGSIYDLMMEKPEIFDILDAKTLEINGGSIDFKNVFFEYVENQPILKNISFSVPAGQTVAIVGPTGSGKSTIVRLIFRLYDIISGSILIDGQDVKDVTQDSLRKAIGVVPQDSVLFNDSIRYNILYGNLNADENQIIEAAKGADLHDSILGFKNGYETEVGQRGLRLSGGEKQRVAIARTILKAPQIVLLDEATSALDTKTERNIQESLRRVCTNRTTLIIAHRLSTIIHADQILVLKGGIIVERGGHEELLEQNGLYASMWKQQLTSEINSD